MSLARNSAKITAIGALGMASGIVVDAIMTAFFGLSDKTDSFFVASTVPLTLITIVGLQAQKVIQPLFIHRRATGGPEAGWQFLNNVMIMGTLITAGICFAGIAFAGAITRMQMSAPAPEAERLAEQLAMLLFLAPILMCPCTLLSAALAGLGDFVVPGMARTVENLAKILVAVLFFSHLGIFVLPAGLLLGILIQNIQVYRALRRHGYRFHFKFNRQDFRISDMASQSGYPFAGHVLTLGFEVLQNTLAMSLGTGALSALRLATRMIDAFSGLVANSVVTAAAPVVAERLSAGQAGAMKQAMQNGMKLLLVLALPSITWIVFLGPACVALLFERRSFSAADTALVASIMALMSPYILLSRLYALAELPFYGARDTKTPLIAQFALAVFYCALMVVFSRMLGVHGFPVARSIAYLGGCLVLALMLRRRYGDLGLPTFALQAWRVLVASTCFGLTIYVCHAFLIRTFPSGDAWQVLILAITGIAGLVVFCWVSVLVRVIDRAVLRRCIDRLMQLLGVRSATPTR